MQRSVARAGSQVIVVVGIQLKFSCIASSDVGSTWIGALSSWAEI